MMKRCSITPPYTLACSAATLSLSLSHIPQNPIKTKHNVKMEEYVNRISGFLEPLVGVNLLALNLDTTFVSLNL